MSTISNSGGAAVMSVTCETCGQDAERLLSPREAREAAATLLAIADRMWMIQLPVDGQG